MQNMQNNMQGPKPICRIVTRLYFAYLTYICTPHFADDSRSVIPSPVSQQRYAHASAMCIRSSRPAGAQRGRGSCCAVHRNLSRSRLLSSRPISQNPRPTIPSVFGGTGGGLNTRSGEVGMGGLARRGAATKASLRPCTKVESAGRRC